MKGHGHNKNEDIQTQAYVCPMHPEVKSGNPGKCEKCGMGLKQFKIENSELKDKGHKGHEMKKHSPGGHETQANGSPGHEGHGHSGHEGHGKGRGHSSHHAHMARDFKKRFFISLAVTIPVLILSPMIQQFLGISGKISFPNDFYVLFLLSAFIYFYGGKPFLTGLFDELKNKKPGMMTLIGLAISVAFIYSAFVVFGLPGKVFFWETVTLIDIMLLGHWIEMKSVMGASKSLEELAKLMPDTAHKIGKNGEIKDVKIEELKQGDKALVKPGEKIPVDGVILKGETSVNEAMLTGESKPVEKKKDDKVIGGSINGEGSVEVEVKKKGDESYLSQVIGLVREAQQSKSKTQNLADKAAMWLTIIAISAGAVTLFVWLAIMKEAFVFGLERTVTVMVITCPHALGLAIPLVVAVSTALAANNGFLIRNRAGFEAARNIDTIVFDKTGTLTQGKFGVTGTKSFSDEMDENEILKYTASLETQSQHPIAKGITESYEGKKYPVENFKSLTGKGAQATVNNKDIKVVSRGYLKENNIGINEKELAEFKGGGRTIVYVLEGDNPVGAIALADIIREDSKRTVNELKKMGIEVLMMTGDSESVAKEVADELGLDGYFAEVLPEHKQDKIKELKKQKKKVAMTGDGVNDAPALAEADTGIAIGAGTDVAVETADIVLVKSNPSDALALIKLSRATYKKMLQNLAWATGYNAFAIPLAAGVLFAWGILLSPAAGAILMSLSTVVVAINARLLKIKT